MFTESLESRADWRDYLQLCKPRVVLLMLLCATVGMCLATTGFINLDLFAASMVGIALMASSAAAINHIADAEIDARMARTKARPMPTGRMTMFQGLTFSAVCGITGFALLYGAVNPLTAWLNLASWVGYGLIYTLYLKRATPQNIVIGGLFGAAPPLFGWTAVTGTIEPGGLLLVLIIFIWTPPHFWALALDRKADYAAADVPMLPITHGETVTRWHILFYTAALFVSSILPFTIGMSGILYLLSALVLGSVFLHLAIDLVRNRNPKTPLTTFRYSILYLMLLFLFLLVDHYIPY